MIELITFTGLDERSDTHRICQLGRRWPKAEFAVLSGSETGRSPRFPTNEWIDAWRRKAEEATLQTAIHLCGRTRRDALAGDEAALARCAGFGRIQLNMPEAERRVQAEAILRFQRRTGRPVVIQHTGAWENAVCSNEPGIEHLFDRSGGQGTAGIDEWPAPRQGKRCGYAGGIGPGNIAEALAFSARHENARIWLDMESKIRRDNWLDANSIEKVLEAAGHHENDRGKRKGC